MQHVFEKKGLKLLSLVLIHYCFAKLLNFIITWKPRQQHWEKYKYSAFQEIWYCRLGTMLSWHWYFLLPSLPFFSLFILNFLCHHFSVLKSFSLDCLPRHSATYLTTIVRSKTARLGRQKINRSRHKMSLEHLFIS